ncbi:hypothetical protein FLP10_11810 [Agromyces intestinalis]|uniref:DUF7144 domain-containing protein n=1 Tax=Agromyces intestinalis TaxID=2592652 RepID=A0A5C1YFY0_9MICO|nr:hypothetical protein [Agromyces intestinalis]QEO15024.1 hypothetical protein FLP10_11810 [Agromyces intestinalis]
MADRAIRPTGVTVVAVLAWISGALDLISGILLLFLLPVQAVVDQFQGTGGLLTAAIASIIVGLIVVLVAGGLLNGNSAARLIVTVVEVLSIIGGLFLVFAYYGNRPEVIWEWLGIFFSLIVLLLLWSRKASEFFRS